MERDLRHDVIKDGSGLGEEECEGGTEPWGLGGANVDSIDRKSEWEEERGRNEKYEVSQGLVWSERGHTKPLPVMASLRVATSHSCCPPAGVPFCLFLFLFPLGLRLCPAPHAHHVLASFCAKTRLQGLHPMLPALPLDPWS